MKKLGAYLLAGAMFLTTVFGGTSTVQLDAAQVSATQLGEGAISVELADGSAATSMEIGDVVTVKIKVNQDMTQVSKLQGVFGYDKDCFTLAARHVTVLEDGANRIYNSATPGQVTVGISFSGDYTEFEDVSGDILEFKLVVKKAIDTAVFTYTDVTVTTDPGEYTGDAKSLTVTNTEADSRKVTIGMSDITAYAQDEFEVPVKILENTGFQGIKLKITYDQKALTCASMDLSDAMKDYVQLQAADESRGVITMSFIAEEDCHLTNKDLVSLKFEANKATTTDIKVEVVEVTNASNVPMKGGETSAEPATAQASITVKEALDLGDVNGDAVVNLVDAAYILQYYNGVRELDAKQLQRADFDDNGTVTLLDALGIMQQYNKEI